MKFLQTVQDSIYSPTFYKTVLKTSFKESLGYFLFLVLLLTAVNLVILIKPLFIETPKAIQDLAQNVINCYPKDLEVKIQNGQATTSAQQPYFVKSCDNNQSILVIDTKTPFSQTQFDSYKTAVWITKDSVVYKKSNFENRSYSLNKMKDFTLNKEVINSYYKNFSPYLKFVGPVLFLLSFLGIFLSFNFRLLHLLLLASLIWLLGKLFKNTVSYGQSYKLGLHAITLGLIVDLLINLVRPWTHFYGFPFMVSVLALGVVIVNLKPTFFPRR